MKDYSLIAKQIEDNTIYKNVALASHNGQDLDGQPDADLFFLHFVGERAGKKHSLKVTDKADDHMVDELTYMDMLKNQFDVFNQLGHKINIDIADYGHVLWPTTDIYRFGNTAMVVMPYFYEDQFLGQQRNRQLNEDEIKKWFEPLAETLWYFDGLSMDHLSFPRNFKNFQQELKNKNEKFKKLRRQFEECHLSLDLFDFLYETWKSRTLQIAFQKYDLVPWWATKNNGTFALLNYHWAGFRDRYYDVAYLYIKLWIHAGKPWLAKRWMKAFYEKLPKNDRWDFEEQIFKPLAERIIVDLLEYRKDENYSKVVYLAKKIASGRICELF